MSKRRVLKIGANLWVDKTHGTHYLAPISDFVVVERGKPFCPECGPGIAIDEDWCCVQCGATAYGRALAEIERCPPVPEGCGGTGLSLGDTCPDCDGHGWKINREAPRRPSDCEEQKDEG